MIPVVKTGRCKHHIASMCGRVIQSNGPLLAPSQDLLVIRRNHDTGAISLDPLRWGLIPYWCPESLTSKWL